MSRGLGVMEQAILAVLDQLHAERSAQAWEASPYDDVYIASVDSEQGYTRRQVFWLADVRTATYRHRRAQHGTASTSYSHTTAFARAFGKLCQANLLRKVWEAGRFTRCRHCGHPVHIPTRDAGVVDLRKW